MAIGRLRAVYSTFRALIHEVAKFGIVGLVNYLLDVFLFNLLLHVGLDDRPLTAKALSTTVAATSSYFMNRHWTWSHRARRGLAREYGLFIALSGVGLAISVAWLAFGEYVLDQHSLLARNFWGNVVGVGTAMVWRFWSFKRWVFLEQEPDRTDDAAHAALV